MDLKPRLSGENSIVVSLATAALVIGIYNMSVGPVSDVHATDAMDGNLAASVKKAGWKAVVAVAALAILAMDPNIVILGGAAIIGEELSYRHALMTNPGSGQIQLTPAAYQPASGQTAPVGPSGTFEAQAG
jgi:hypothetical protein